MATSTELFKQIGDFLQTPIGGDDEEGVVKKKPRTLGSVKQASQGDAGRDQSAAGASGLVPTVQPQQTLTNPATGPVTAAPTLGVPEAPAGISTTTTPPPTGLRVGEVALLDKADARDARTRTSRAVASALGGITESAGQRSTRLREDQSRFDANTFGLGSKERARLASGFSEQLHAGDAKTRDTGTVAASAVSQRGLARGSADAATQTRILGDRLEAGAEEDRTVANTRVAAANNAVNQQKALDKQADDLANINIDLAKLGSTERDRLMKRRLTFEKALLELEGDLPSAETISTARQRFSQLQE